MMVMIKVVVLLFAVAATLTQASPYTCIPGFGPGGNRLAQYNVAADDDAACAAYCDAFSGCASYSLDPTFRCQLFDATYGGNLYRNSAMHFCLQTTSPFTCFFGVQPTTQGAVLPANSISNCMAEVSSSGSFLFYDDVVNGPSCWLYDVSLPALTSSNAPAGSLFCTYSCSSYNPFADSISPAFPTVSVSATQIDQNMNSVITVSLGQSSTSSLRYLLVADSFAATGALSTLGQDPATFWNTNDLAASPPVCGAVRTIQINPINSCGQPTTANNVITYSCTVYAALLIPNPLDPTQYLATVNAINVPYSFNEVVDTSGSTEVIGVFCGVGVTSLSCVSTSADLSGASIDQTTAPYDPDGILTYSSCSLTGTTTFQISCDIVPLTQVPVSSNFWAVLDAGSHSVTVGQRINVPIPAHTSVNDSAVSLSSFPEIVGNKDTPSFTVTTKIGGTVTVIGLSAVESDNTVVNLNGCWSQDPSGGASSVTITWDVSCSVLQDVSLYVGTLTLQVSTLVTLGGGAPDRRQLRAQGTSQYTANTVTVGSFVLQGSQQSTSATTAAHGGLSAGALGAIVVASVLGVTLLAGLVVVKVMRGKPSQPTQELPVAKVVNPFNADEVHCCATQLPNEDTAVDVVELGQSD